MRLSPLFLIFVKVLFSEYMLAFFIIFVKLDKVICKHIWRFLLKSFFIFAFILNYAMLDYRI
ncbi:hypothetical protein COT27_01745 [Candidatus Kuenenbacteria bacterium CG08_land_8_20_14_0_20_37_23]|uniref:Uncharacterized protein n=2 Tax=Candidatus Kueneniibacteriota TaxID=1752740 RepID=A0A2M6XST7_9BACT|nr:MAG: hypothetical protein AUJ29_00930 [Candidatus Kuenenbacteria bacterium CG1_02_38_13]PIU10704.1 MAG: hypothetical protein COT27_01745 [Candidatus Kuenenbacteria bacterium CG08_land_8_20_14_0_20_37_23]